MSKYPAQIDTIVSLPKVADNLSAVTGETVNRLREAIIAIESELGIKPSGVYSTVRARLDALDAALTNLSVGGLEGDVTGGLTTTKVMGLGGRPLSDQAPSVSQVIGWNGIAWVPTTLSNIVVNVLPTNILLPNEVNFLSGDGYNNTSNPTRIGARAINMALFPISWPDGRIRTIKFKADLEVTNAAADGYVRIKDVTNNAIIINSLLKSKSLASTEYSVTLTTDTIDGYLRDQCCNDVTMYEIQIYITGGGANDYVICRNARLEFTYSSPILVSALQALALPTDIQFIAGMSINGFTTPAGMGGRVLDLASFPSVIPSSRVRTIKFMADVEVSAPGVDGYVQLFDTTHNVAIDNTTFKFNNTIVSEVSVILPPGSSNGLLRSDAPTRYELRMWKVSGSPADRVMCSNARLQITYAV